VQFGRATRADNLPVAQNVATHRYAQSQAEVLLRHHDRHAAAGQCGNRLV
jgi:hypothetical protein